MLGLMHPASSCAQNYMLIDESCMREICIRESQQQQSTPAGGASVA
jgi:hypothetical protein